MNDEKITESFIKLTGELSALNANMKNVLDKLTNHEQRLANLEQKKEDGWKNQLLMLLAKATVIGLVAIGSLTGASSLIQKVLSPSIPTQEVSR
jgi:beta-lactamase regulating signal transducer with metallopeptidase domain